MKRIITLLMVVSILFLSISCGSYDGSFSLGESKKEMFSGDDGLMNALKAEEDSSNYYVLVPQYARIEKAVSPKYSFSNVGETDRVLTEYFYVCLPTTLQYADVGQYGAIPYHFIVKIAINTDYETDKALNVKFKELRKYEHKEFNLTERLFDIYNGDECFATARVEFFNFDSADNMVRIAKDYIAENLKSKTEFIQICESNQLTLSQGEAQVGDIETNRLLYTYYNTTPFIKLDLSDEETWWENFVSEVQLQLNGLNKSLIIIKSDKQTIADGEHYYRNKWQWFSISGKDCNDEGIIEELYLYYSFACEGYALTDGVYLEFTDFQTTNFISVPFVLSDFDKELIEFEYVGDGYVNLYYQEFCFASATYGFSSITEKEKTKEQRQEYFEEFIKQNVSVIEIL